MGLSLVCDCGIFWSYSLTFYIILNYNNVFLHLINIAFNPFYLYIQIECYEIVIYQKLCYVSNDKDIHAYNMHIMLCICEYQNGK